MVLTFNEAVDYLNGMFPAWDRDSLSAILSANEGRMGRTIDEILNMDAKTAAAIRAQPSRIQIMRSKRPSVGPGTPKRITIDGSSGQPLSPNTSKRVLSKSNPNFRNRVENNVVYRGVKFILPDSFLSLPEDPNKLAGKKNRKSVMDDEKLAHLLKNEQFRNRLEAYGYSFRPGEGPESGRTPTEPAPVDSPTEAVARERISSQRSVLPVDDGSIKTTIATLGETTKRNLSLLAFRFMHGVDEMTPLDDGKAPEFDFDDVYEKDEAMDLDATSKSFSIGKATSPKDAHA